MGSLGKAYIFVHDGRRWVEQQILTVAGYGAAQHFGGGAWFDGDTCVVSAQRDGSMGEDSGSAFVFVRSGTHWSLQQRLNATDPAVRDSFGVCAISGDRILVGAPGKNSAEGMVCEFTRTGTVWRETQKLITGEPSGGLVGALFGGRIVWEGNTAVISATGADGHAADTGAAYVFTGTSAGWVLQQKLTARDGSFLDVFGIGLALAGDSVPVGAIWDDDHGDSSGSTYVFTRTGTLWSERHKLVASDAAAGHGYGYALAVVSPDELLVGALEHDGLGDEAGLVYVVGLQGPNVTLFNGRGINPDTLTASDALVGQTWTANIGVAATHGPGLAYLYLSDACQGGTPILGGRAEILLGGSPRAILAPLPHAGQGSSVSFATSIPADPGLVGRRWAAQGVVLGGFVRLTNAATGSVQ